MWWLLVLGRIDRGILLQGDGIVPRALPTLLGRGRFAGTVRAVKRGLHVRSLQLFKNIDGHTLVQCRGVFPDFSRKNTLRERPLVGLKEYIRI